MLKLIGVEIDYTIFNEYFPNFFIVLEKNKLSSDDTVNAAAVSYKVSLYPSSNLK
jgi:hypothetical protein